MIELAANYPQTVAALLAAHCLADFVFQSRRMAQNKRQWPMLLAHGAIVYVSSALLLFSLINPLALAVALVHLLIDAIKCRLPSQGAMTFAGDQALHLLTIALLPLTPLAGGFALPVDVAGPQLTAALGVLVPELYLVIFGLIYATRAGSFAVDGLMLSISPPEQRAGLPGGGRVIGLLERGLVWALVMVGQIGAIGWLLGAKSILRFGTIKEDRAASEYVIIGTLASVGWALAVGFVCVLLRDLLA